jgi:5-methylcytosine-specific restriction endonuclease McrA
VRRVSRPQLADALRTNLDARQATADLERADGNLNITEAWKGARQTATLAAILAVLKGMMGHRERCMYCVDSHGSDIDHFWPKVDFPERIFRWSNFLLCCAECGRFKGRQFPLANGQPLLVDPSVEEPWLHLDFDPATGNITARFDAQANQWSEKGLMTVKILQLDRREAMAAGYRRTLRRILTVIERHVANQELAATLPSALEEADDHGLLSWCVFGTGKDLAPIRALRDLRPDSWAACQAILVA